MYVQRKRHIRQHFVAVIDLERAQRALGPRVERVHDEVRINGVVHMTVHIDVGIGWRDDERRLAFDFEI